MMPGAHPLGSDRTSPMVIDSDFLAKLVCPRTRKPLRLLSGQELQEWNAAIAAGRVRTRAGTAVAEPLQAALAPEGESTCYRVEDDIPILLIDEALQQAAAGAPDASRA